MCFNDGEYSRTPLISLTKSLGMDKFSNASFTKIPVVCVLCCGIFFPLNNHHTPPLLRQLLPTGKSRKTCPNNDYIYFFHDLCCKQLCKEK